MRGASGCVSRDGNATTRRRAATAHSSTMEISLRLPLAQGSRAFVVIGMARALLLTAIAMQFVISGASEAWHAAAR